MTGRKGEPRGLVAGAQLAHEGSPTNLFWRVVAWLVRVSTRAGGGTKEARSCTAGTICSTCRGRTSPYLTWGRPHQTMHAPPSHAGRWAPPSLPAAAGLAYLPPGAPFPGLPASSGGRQGGKAATPVCFATGGERGVVQLWRADTGKCVYEQPAAAAAAASAAGGIVELELLPGGAGLLTATQDCRLLMHAPAGGDLAVTRQLIGNNDEVTDMRFLTLGGGDGGDGGGDGAPTHLAVSTNSDQIRLFDARTLSCTATLAGHTDTVLALDALRLPGGAALLASAGKDASLRLWSLPAARCVGERRLRVVRGLQFSIAGSSRRNRP